MKVSTSLSDTGEDVVGSAVIKLCTGALLGDFVGSDEGGVVVGFSVGCFVVGIKVGSSLVGDSDVGESLGFGVGASLLGASVVGEDVDVNEGSLDAGLASLIEGHGVDIPSLIEGHGVLDLLGSFIAPRSSPSTALDSVVVSGSSVGGVSKPSAAPTIPVSEPSI